MWAENIRTANWNDKIWTTKSTDNQTLFEFADKTQYKKGKPPSKKYNLPLPFSVRLPCQSFKFKLPTLFYRSVLSNHDISIKILAHSLLDHNMFRKYPCKTLCLQGNDHVVYNRSFFYLNLESESIVRFDLRTLRSQKFRIPTNRVVQNSGLGILSDRLYAPQQPFSHLDFSTDENGVWAIAGLKASFFVPRFF